MTWHWSDPTIANEDAQTFELRLTKNLGTRVVQGTLTITPGTSTSEEILEEILAPAVAAGWTPETRRRTLRYESDLTYGG
ncbi:hypothetical protein OG742_37050 [Streptomyces sp. NBC_00828]|uniref:hypothetical protein n=1 Tax=Streptomyces sp. NBC_00828 TaxID=2903678 RepID=UPI003868B498